MSAPQSAGKVAEDISPAPSHHRPLGTHQADTLRTQARGFFLGIAPRGTFMALDEDELFEEEPVSDEEIIEILQESPWLRLRLRLLFWWMEIREWLGSLPLG